MTGRSKKVSELDALVANTIANNDLFIVVDVSQSATKKATANSIANYFAALGTQGPQGPQGSQGAAGTNGTNGINGTNGTSGAQGDQGAQGDTGAQGATGSQGGFYSPRSTASVTTPTISNNSIAQSTISGFKGYVLYKINTSIASRVRLYASEDSRENDLDRIEAVDPTPGSGIIAEVVTSGNQTVLITPGVIGFNNDDPPSENIYASITNKSGSSNSVTVTLTLVNLESE